METRIALIGIILESRQSVDELNHLLSEYGEYVIGRMGIPYREKGIHVISVAVDAPNSVISALSGKLGSIPQVSSKALYSKEICGADAERSGRRGGRILRYGHRAHAGCKIWD